MKKKTLLSTVFLASLGLLLAASAFAGPHHWRGGARYQMALNACENQKAGDKVTIETPCGYKVEGTCVQQGDALVADIWAPCAGGCGYGRGHWKQGSGPGYGRGAGMVMGACQGKPAGTKVSFETPNGAKVDITCGNPPSAEPKTETAK